MYKHYINLPVCTGGPDQRAPHKMRFEVCKGWYTWRCNECSCPLTQPRPGPVPGDSYSVGPQVSPRHCNTDQSHLLISIVNSITITLYYYRAKSLVL